MNAGAFDHKIVLTIPSGSAVLDNFGQASYTYYTSSVWAKVDTKSGNQTNTNGIIFDSAYYDFTIRYRTDITEDTKITYKNQDYRILFIEETKPRNSYLRLSAQRRN